ncbi:unnamed protein product [Clonostachys byssicola]|uniref:Zn(2)-C6 fungal-type domain-containing protein n=1 Tax=Clonostachys byssicola TaxID=160290 RepID=A0A9N9Y536_9HYPO|nr:unnamed protein product [Clonostachys byssicola]
MMNACLACRKVKMKCRAGLAGGDSRCERCAKKSIDCVFQEHRRGRKPGTRITRARHASPTRASQPASQYGALTGSSYHTSLTPVSQINEDVSSTEPSDLQPSGLLNLEAGKFSLQYILGSGNGDNVNSSPGPGSLSNDDPIHVGLINLQLAGCLFQSFMDVLNPYICQLDPDLHTISYVREKSPFLFTAILAMAAKAFDTTMYRPLYDHANQLMGVSFCQGVKSTECAQAIMILTYWKEPQDTRAWTLLGYVIRMCMDLGWHKLKPPLMQYQQAMSEEQRREARNIERTWYVLFVYDRSISLQTGRPFMIEQNEFIDVIEEWCKDPMSLANDYFLGALVKLRLETSAAFSLLGFRQRRTYTASLHETESLLALIHGRIQDWENRWIDLTKAVEPADDISCHHFLILFYGTHLRLQLFLLPLQNALASDEAESYSGLEVLWIAYSSAIDLLQVVSQRSSQLYIAQDSVHIMIAYAAAFLVKLLLLAPKTMVAKIEPSIIDVMRNAALALSQQSPPSGSSCALQAAFLDKITSNLTVKSRSDTRPISSRLTPLPTEADDVTSKDSGLFSIEGTDNIFEATNMDLQLTDDEGWASIFAQSGFDLEDGVFLN